MEKIFFSAATLGFYPESLKQSYENGSGWPDDAVEVTVADWLEYAGSQPVGKRIGANEHGYPAWENVPPPTRDEIIKQAEQKKQRFIDAANNYINSKQWPGKAAIGRLKGEELAQYNLWLDYLDALELVDTSGTPDIEWPTPPAVQAR
ncbi:tail fiber assembly protein [Escherichia coli]